MLTGWLHKGAERPELIFYRNEKTIHRLAGQIEVCPENTENAGKEHYQVFVQFIEKKRLTGVCKLFPSGQWRNTAQQFGSSQQMEDYCTKKDTRKPGCEPFTFGGELILERKSSKLQLAIQALKQGATMHAVAMEHSESFVRSHVGLEKLSSRINTPLFIPKYALESFSWAPITDWSKSQVFYGLSGIGKSQFALAHFKSPLFVSHMDQLANFEAQRHDGIVFDDMSFLHTPREAQIHIIDIDLPRAIHIRYHCANIPAGVKKIFTTNNPGGIIFSGQGIDLAIDRRIKSLCLLAPGFKSSV